MVADSVAVFAETPIEGAAAEIQGWAERQQALQPNLPLADLLFHAIHKLSVIGEFELVDAPRLLTFLGAVGTMLADACRPGESRERLRRGLAHLGESEMVRTGPFELLHASGPIRAELALPAATSGQRRLTFLEERLLREVAIQGTAAENARRRVASQAIVAAATEARSERSCRTTSAASAPPASSPGRRRSSAASARSSRTGPCRRTSSPTPSTSASRTRSGR